MRKTLPLLSMALCSLTLVMGLAQPELELMEHYGDVTAVDLARGQISVFGGGNEVLFDVTDETEIIYIDPETDLEEPLELSDLELGTMVLVKYSAEGNTNLAWRIEVRSPEMG
jgi:hypothetical protein